MPPGLVHDVEVVVLDPRPRVFVLEVKAGRALVGAQYPPDGGGPPRREDGKDADEVRVCGQVFLDELVLANALPAVDDGNLVLVRPTLNAPPIPTGQPHEKGVVEIVERPEAVEPPASKATGRAREMIAGVDGDAVDDVIHVVQQRRVVAREFVVADHEPFSSSRDVKPLMLPSRAGRRTHLSRSDPSCWAQSQPEPGSFPAETARRGRGNSRGWQMTFFRVSDLHEHA